MKYRFWSDSDWFYDYPNKKAFLKDMVKSGRLQKLRKSDFKKEVSKE